MTKKKGKFKTRPDKKRFGFQVPSENRNADTQKPIFSLKYMNTDKFGIDKCEQKEKAAFANTLCKLSKLPWAEINQANRHGCGYEKIARNSIKAGIPSFIDNKDDIGFLAFRFDGKKPMVGYRDGYIFHVIWLDRDFTLYKHC